MEAIRKLEPKLGSELSCFPLRSFLGKHGHPVPFKVTRNTMACDDEQNDRKFKNLAPSIWGHKFANPHVDVSTNLLRECKLSLFTGKAAKLVPLKATTNTLACEDEENHRNFIQQGHSEWHHKFISAPVDLSELDALEREIMALKPKVRDMFMSLKGSKKKILFIYMIVSLGLEYHFENEIKETLKDGFQKIDEIMAGEDDLYTVSIIFWVFRRYRHNISSDVFRRFKGENNGEFKECLALDAKGLLSLYEAAHIGTTTDYILDEAMSFTLRYLETLAASETCKPSLSRSIRYALGLVQHKNMDILVAKEYILFYEQEEDCDKMLLKFSKLNFKFLQLQHLQELKVLSKWYKEQDFESKLPPYFRDRFVELAFASLAYIEPKHSRLRIMLTKLYTIQIILDDTCDRYASLHEVECLANALERWDIHDEAMDGLPDYMKVVVRFIFDTFQEYEKELGSELGGPYSLQATIEDLKGMMRANLQLAKWARAGHLPSLEEYLDVAGCEIAVYFTLAGVLMGMDHSIGKRDAYEWLKSRDKLVKAMTDKARITNDMFGYKDDMSRGYVTSSVNCYMKQYGVTKEEAFKGLCQMVEDLDKMMNEELMKPINVPDEVLKVVIDTLRAINVTYDKEDGFTVPEKYLRDRITAMYVDLI